MTMTGNHIHQDKNGDRKDGKDFQLTLQAGSGSFLKEVFIMMGINMAILQNTSSQFL